MKYIDQLDDMRIVLSHCLWLEEISYSQKIERGDFKEIFKATTERCKDIIGTGSHKHSNFMGLDQPFYGGGLIPAFDISSGWEYVLLHHCLLSTFIHIRELRGLEHMMTMYNATKIKLLAEKDKNRYAYGMDYSFYSKSPIVTFCSNSKKNSSSEKLKVNYKESASNFQSAFKNNIKAISKSFLKYSKIKYVALVPSTPDNSKHHCLHWNDLDFINLIMSEPKYLSTLSSVLKGYGIRDSDQKLLSWNYGLFKDAKSKYNKYIASNYFLKNSDRLYLHYQLESLFNFNLADTIYAIKKELSSSHTINMSDSLLTDIVSVARLPNTFSRHYCLQYFVDCLVDTERDFTKNFYDTYTDRGLVFKADKTRNSLFGTSHYTNWLTLFRKTISYLADYAFPIYESAFLEQLLVTYDCKFDEQSIIQCLSDIYSDLVKYFDDNDNYDSIIHFDEVLHKAANHIYPKEKYKRAEMFRNFCDPDLSSKEVKEYREVLLKLNDTWKAPTPFTIVTKDFIKERSSLISENTKYAIFQGIINK